MGRIIGGLVIIGFNALVVKAWLLARTAAAHAQGPAPSPVRYGVIIGFSALVLLALVFSGRKKNRPAASTRGGYSSSWDRGR
jgi:hypothetical protein